MAFLRPVATSAVASFALVSIAVVSFAATSARTQSPAEIMTARTFASKRHGELPYRWLAPAGAAGAAGAGDAGAGDAGDAGAGERAAPTFPLVLFLHGAGERGNDNRRQLEHGVRTFVDGASQRERPCFVAAPQCPRGRWWDVDELVEFAAAMAAEPGVDRDRVYVTGLSMGGFATWQLAGTRPDLFAAVLPICGGGRTEHAVALSLLPVWAFHGDADRTVRVAETRTMIDAIRRVGGDPKYTEYPGVGHDSWTRTYADPAVHAWLFAQRRQTLPRPLRDGDRVVIAGAPESWLAGAAPGESDESGRPDETWPAMVAAALGERRVGVTVEVVGIPQGDAEALLTSKTARVVIFTDGGPAQTELPIRAELLSLKWKAVSFGMAVQTIDLRPRLVAAQRAREAAGAPDAALLDGTAAGARLTDAGRRLATAILQQILLQGAPPDDPAAAK